jgi:hypothetical protein
VNYLRLFLEIKKILAVFNFFQQPALDAELFQTFNSRSFDGFLARLSRRRPKTELFLPIIRETVKVLVLNCLVQIIATATGPSEVRTRGESGADALSHEVYLSTQSSVPAFAPIHL